MLEEYQPSPHKAAIPNNIQSSNSTILIVRTKCSWNSDSRIIELNPYDTVGEAMDAQGFNWQTLIGSTDQTTTSSKSNKPDPKSIFTSQSQSPDTQTSIHSNTSSHFNQSQQPDNSPTLNQLYFICRGKVLNPNLTFNFQGVKSGMTIFIQLKIIKKNRYEKKEKFLESLRTSSQFKLDFNRRYGENRYFKKFGYDFGNVLYQPHEGTVENDIAIEESKKMEIYRLNDLAFRSWETIVEFPTLLKEILENEEEENQKNANYFNSSNKQMYKLPNGIDMNNNNLKMNVNQNLEAKTIIQPATKICDQPLPNPFVRKSCIFNTTYYKSAGNEYANVSTTEMEDHFSKI